MLEALLLTFKERLQNLRWIFFYLGAIPFFKVLLGVHSPHLAVVTQDWEYHGFKNLGCSIRIKFVKNCPLPNTRKRVKGLFF